jgi:hypothetical protein
MYYSTIILSNIYLQELPEKDEAEWLEKAVLAAIDEGVIASAIGMRTILIPVDEMRRHDTYSPLRNARQCSSSSVIGMLSTNMRPGKVVAEGCGRRLYRPVIKSAKQLNCSGIERIKRGRESEVKHL